MSRAPSTSIIEVQARIAEVATSLGGMPDVVSAALQEAMFDLVNHHRRGILRHHQMPSKTRGRKMLAAQLHRYTKRGMDRSRPIEMTAESFGASSTPKFLLNLEHGGRIQTDEWMAIPTEGGIGQLGNERITHRNFRKFLASRTLRVVWARGRLLLIHDAKARTVKGTRIGERSIVMGELRKSRTQRPLLGFEATWNRNLPKQLAKIDRILGMAVTEAGRIKLARGQEASRASTSAYYAELDRQLAGNGGKMTGAVRKAANDAARLAKAASLAKTEGGS